MRRFFASFYRITSRTGFLFTALVLGLVLRYLPSLLSLDEFRPQLTAILEHTFHCQVLVGEVTGELVPSPGLIIGHVVLLENSKTPHVLASVSSVRMALLIKPLLKGSLEINAIRFLRPRFIARLVRERSGPARWVMLSLPRASSSQENVGIDEWQVRNGSVEIWDQTQTPTTKWVANQFTGSFRVREQTGAIEGKSPLLGREAVIDVHYNAAAAFPVHARLNHIELHALQFLLPARLLTLEGTADIVLQTRFQPVTQIRAELDQPSGAGQVTVAVDHGSRGTWQWSVLGKHTLLKGTAFELPEWSAKGDEQGVAVYARGTTPQGGMTEVGWTKPASSPDAVLDVDASSVTVRQILQLFKAQSQSPVGYEPWLIRQGSIKALIRDGAALEIQESDIDVAGMHLDMTGTFDLKSSTPQAHLQGELQTIPVPAIVESFFPPPSPLTGTGAATFTLSFPLSADWIKGLTGPIEISMGKGVLKALKTIYRISSVLNLGNYLRLRLPRVTAQGIEFESLSAHMIFQNGVLSTEDLFLKSRNMNVGAKGSLDIPGKRVNVTLRLEMFRFLEDILRDVPLTHWIFKKPTKIFLPLVVIVEGPWDNVDVR